MNRQILSDLKSRFYRRPKDELTRLSRWGIDAYLHCHQWAQNMERSARVLTPPVFGSSLRPIEVWFLTGEKFWYQTAYCAWTLSQQTGREIIVNLVDDGTLTNQHLAPLRHLFPKGAVLSSETVALRLDALLPRASYPVLRDRCDDYINIRKLVDVHLGSTGWKLVLDSDMLFFSRPDEMLDWWDRLSDEDRDAPVLLMQDCKESYGYSREGMTSLTGSEIPPLLNVGVCGLRSESIQWPEVEHWCATLHENEGTSYFLEQALVAMMASRRNYHVLSAENYITLPTAEEARTGAGVLQHYVSDSKPLYFGHAWKIARDTAIPSQYLQVPV